MLSWITVSVEVGNNLDAGEAACTRVVGALPRRRGVRRCCAGRASSIVYRSGRRAHPQADRCDLRLLLVIPLLGPSADSAGLAGGGLQASVLRGEGIDPGAQAPTLTIRGARRAPRLAPIGSLRALLQPVHLHPRRLELRKLVALRSLSGDLTALRPRAAIRHPLKGPLLPTQVALGLRVGGRGDGERCRAMLRDLRAAARLDDPRTTHERALCGCEAINA